MGWIAVRPLYKRGDVDRSGRTIASKEVTIFEYHEALGVVNNWRSAHSFPLNTFQTNLRDRARRVDASSLIAQRLKRLVSIEAKLRRFPKMPLSQMQDLGGCRAVLKNAKLVYELVAMYEESTLKNAKRHEFLRKVDYIAVPKPDGYRGVHLIYKYLTPTKKYRDFNGLRIEVQLRSQLQHAWATAVETVDTFTGQALKSSAGNDRWARFFVLTSAMFALRERMPLPPNMPHKTALIRELRKIMAELKVVASLQSWQVALRHIQDTGTADADIYLIVFDLDKWSVSARGYKSDALEMATDAYMTVERSITTGANLQAVLVGVDSLDALRKAYPSYYVDTSAFINALNHAIS